MLGHNFQLIHYKHFSSGLDSMSALHVPLRQAIEKQSCKLQKVSFNTSKVRMSSAPNNFYCFKYHWLPLLRQTESAQGNHNHLSNVDLVVYHRQGPVFEKLHWLRLDSKSNAFIGGHCDTIPHSVRIRRFLRSPKQLPQVALHESLVLNLSSCDYAATASPWRYSILLDRHFLRLFDMFWSLEKTADKCWLP